MTQTTEVDQKEQTAAWDKRCNKLALKYLVVSFPTGILLGGAFGLTLVIFLNLLLPLVTGEVAFGEAGYNEYQEAKDLALIVLAVLFVLNVAAIVLWQRWYKKRLRALGPRPGGTGRWKRWLYSIDRDGSIPSSDRRAVHSPDPDGI